MFTLERNIVHQLELTRQMLTRNANAIRSFNNKISGHQKQLARDLTYQKSIQFNEESSEIISVDLFNKSTTKDVEDIVSRASEGILLLQNTYTLKTDQLIRGVIRSHRDDVNPIPPIKMEGRESLGASIHFEQDYFTGMKEMTQIRFTVSSEQAITKFHCKSILGFHF